MQPTLPCVQISVTHSAVIDVDEHLVEGRLANLDLPEFERGAVGLENDCLLLCWNRHCVMYEYSCELVGICDLCPPVNQSDGDLYRPSSPHPGGHVSDTGQENGAALTLSAPTWPLKLWDPPVECQGPSLQALVVQTRS